MAGDIVPTKDAEGFYCICVPEKYSGRTVAEVLRLMGFDIDLPCGGNGRCGKCSANIVFEKDGRSDVRFLKICTTRVPSDEKITVKLPPNMFLGEADIDLKAAKSSEEGLTVSSGEGFLAVDVGTTTVEAVLWNKDRQLCHFAVLNPQKKYGADVISRIAFSETEGGLERMTADIRDCVDSMLSKCRESFPDIRISNVYIAGNTTMQHIFLGVSPSGIGKYPFTPAFTETKVLKGADAGLRADNVTLLPSADAFIGADAVAGAELYLAEKNSDNTLFIDLGTNGEMVLLAGGKYYATSSAAGPCFEGANISCGTGGIEGAVSCFKDTENGMLLRTIGNRPAVGICGSGLLSLIALLLDKGIIDETGLMEEDHEIKGRLAENIDSPTLAEASCDPTDTGLTLTRKDVREFQLAKAAVRTGIEIILEKGGIRPSDIKTVFTAGGLGSFIDPKDALKTGLFPPEFRGKIVAPGNTSLEGAVAAGRDPGFTARAGELASKIDSFSLNDAKGFNTRFVDNMYFE